MGNLLFIFGAPILAVIAIYTTAGPVWGTAAALGIAVWWFYPGIAKRRRAAAAEERALLAAKEMRAEADRVAALRAISEAKARQEFLKSELLACVRDAMNKKARITDALKGAASSLKSAHAEFAEGAFAPFWDEVAECVRQLATLQLEARGIAEDARRHMDASEIYDGPVPAFPVRLSTVEHAKERASELESECSLVIRRAQKDFQFATIYEQRKTNSILVQGFSSLSDAIGRLSSTMRSSFEEVSARLEELQAIEERQHASFISASADLHAAVQEQVASSAESAEAAAKQRAKLAVKQGEEADRQLAMLDNIQRKRRPLPSERGPRKF